VGDSGTVLLFRGGRWSTLPAPTTHILRGVAIGTRGDVWVVGDSGTVARWAGSSWRIVEAPTIGPLRAVDEIDGELYVIGAEGTAWRREGAGWVTLNSGLPVLLLGIDGRSADDIVIVGDVAAILAGVR
jgi:hypothetical protein